MRKRDWWRGIAAAMVLSGVAAPRALAAEQDRCGWEWIQGPDLPDPVTDSDELGPLHPGSGFAEAVAGPSWLVEGEIEGTISTFLPSLILGTHLWTHALPSEVRVNAVWVAEWHAVYSSCGMGDQGEVEANGLVELTDGLIRLESYPVTVSAKLFARIRCSVWSAGGSGGGEGDTIEVQLLPRLDWESTNELSVDMGYADGFMAGITASGQVGGGSPKEFPYATITRERDRIACVNEFHALMRVQTRGQLSAGWGYFTPGSGMMEFHGGLELDVGLRTCGS